MTDNLSAPAVPEFTVVGEALIDVVRAVDGTVLGEHVGGSPANVAVGLARLGRGVRFATWIGRDERGRRIAESFQAEGVSVTPGSFGAEHTSTATARLDESGAAAYEFDFAFDLDGGLALAADGHLHIGSISATTEPGASKVAALAQAARGRATVSYDPNVRPALMGGPDEARPRVEALIAASHVVKASAEDADWLYPGLGLDGVIALWLGSGPALAVLTDGSRGALAGVAQERFTVAAPSVAVVDTVGAGDTFMAALLDGLATAGLLGRAASLRGATVDQLRPLVERAGRAAAINCTRPGADPPTRAELDRASN